MLVISIILCTLYHRFSASIALIKSVSIVTVRLPRSFIFQNSSKSLKLIANSCNNRNTTPINRIKYNSSEVSFALLSFLKQESISYMLSLAINIEQCRKKF